jgi:hypothetical protein
VECEVNEPGRERERGLKLDGGAPLGFRGEEANEAEDGARRGRCCGGWVGEVGEVESRRESSRESGVRGVRLVVGGRGVNSMNCASSLLELELEPGSLVAIVCCQQGMPRMSPRKTAASLSFSFPSVVLLLVAVVVGGVSVKKHDKHLFHIT